MPPRTKAGAIKAQGGKKAKVDKAAEPRKRKKPADSDSEFEADPEDVEEATGATLDLDERMDADMAAAGAQSGIVLEDDDEDGIRDPSVRAAQRAAILEPDDDDGSMKDFSSLPLKADHARRPLWVLPNGHIFLEARSAMYQQAYDFLVAIAEPVSRPTFVHEYKLTPYSLYAAVSVSLETESIIAVLDRLSKVPLPERVATFIRQSTRSYGKAKLVLVRNRFWIESTSPEVLRHLLTEPTIAEARVADPLATSEFQVTEALRELDENTEYQRLCREDDEDDEGDVPGAAGAAGAVEQAVSFEVRADHVERVRRAAMEMDYPLMEEYDFRNDTLNPNVPIDLKPSTRIRSYQEKSLSKMFGNGRARSGLIVLPCGAGKTLTGVTAASTVKKRCIVLCTSTVSVSQWRYQFMLWSNIDERFISCFTSQRKDPITEQTGLVITTYPMIAFQGKRSGESERALQQIRSLEWGLMLLDEVHVVPARLFRRTLEHARAHCKLGLTATLVREDNLISDLNFLIGPKLYEANWMDLTDRGFLASVQCVEVWCPMTPSFYTEYLRQADGRKRELLYVTNPNKFQVCEYLVRYHEARGDRTILFSDNIFALKLYATSLKAFFIHGETRENERHQILHAFRTHPSVRTICLSKVGDTSIDIPEANVIIQVSSHFGSRRQEAQRLGRILRPKERGTERFNAFFYTLVSTDTQEMFYSNKRRQYLVDQGYTFKVVTDLLEKQPEARANLQFGNPEDQTRLLNEVLNAQDEDDEDEEQRRSERAAIAAAAGRPSKKKARRSVGSLGARSGATGGTYAEFAKGAPTHRRNALFKARYRKT